MYKIAICDDLTQEREVLQGLAHDYFTRACLTHDIAVFSNGEALLGAFQSGLRFDIYMLDILMPGLNGMELAKKLRQQDESGVIAFITSTSDYAVQGYSVGALDYIVKPISGTAVDTVLSRIVGRLTQTGTLAINIQSKYDIKELKTSEIVYVESRDHFVLFNIFDGSVERVYTSIEKYDEHLTKYAFFARCHKSYIVNLNYVVKMKWGSFYLKDGRSIGISRSYLNDCREKYHKHIFDKTKVFIN